MSVGNQLQSLEYFQGFLDFQGLLIEQKEPLIGSFQVRAKMFL